MFRCKVSVPKCWLLVVVKTHTLMILVQKVQRSLYCYILVNSDGKDPHLNVLLQKRHKIMFVTTDSRDSYLNF